MNPLRAISRAIGRMLAAYLAQPLADFRPSSVTPYELLRETVRPGDILLVEGRLRVSVAIRYLTQSTWSHAALVVGDAVPPTDDGEPMLVEADLEDGVIAVPLSKYAEFSTRICRPAGLSEDEIRAVIGYAVGRLGDEYDLANVVDLVRYLAPTPPVPQRFRRRMIALGSGAPTRAICSTLIAQAFQQIRYPILPEPVRLSHCDVKTRRLIEREIYHIRHHSLYTPADFDLSPYFAIVKPTIAAGFDHRKFPWSDAAEEASPPATRVSPARRGAPVTES